MNALHEQALAWMRQMILATLSQTATLYSPTQTADDGGGYATDWQLVAENIPCRLDAIASSANHWQLVNDSPAPKRQYRAVFLHSAPLQPDMRVVVDDVAYAIINSSTAHGAKLVVHAVIVEE